MVFFAALSLSACAHGPDPKVAGEILAEEDRAQILTVAVLPFEDNSLAASPETAGLGRTLADGIADRLSDERALVFIDRESIDKILEELALSSGGLTESDHRLRLGHLLGAQYLVVGGYMAIGTSLRVDARVIEVERGLAEGRAVEGGLEARRDIERALSQKISEVLLAKANRGSVLRPTSSLDYYRSGLALEKKKRFQQALSHYQQALALDVENQPARERMEALLLKELE